MNRRWLALSAVFVLPLALRAQEEAYVPPASGLVGNYRITVEATPTEVMVADPVTLTVRITGQGPAKYQPVRKKIEGAIFPKELSADFIIEPEKAGRAGNTWTFAYRFRPKHANVKQIPALELEYFNPRLAKVQADESDPIDLTVSPRPDVVTPEDVVETLRPPQQAYHIVTGTGVLERSGSGWLSQPLALLFIVPP